MSVTPPTPVRPSCLKATDEPGRFTTVTGTGISGTLCCDTPSERSPVATTTVGERRTISFSLLIPGIPFAPRSVYAAPTTTAPDGDSAEPAGGSYEPRGGNDGPAVFRSLRLRM